LTADRLELFAALAKLTPRHRAAVIHRYYHDYDYATIARILGTTSTNVGAMLSRALDRLRVELDPPSAVAADEGRR
jgi:RNA polymerase sigma factor (sigma-70 family)